ncbi:MAG: FAD-dependent oxidoreductase, partial [Candidatus Bathyarchaeia archaeon]
MRVGIVGAGPAGLFTAYELAEKTTFEVVVIEQGSDLHNRKHRLHGIGGAGTFSDGKLNIDPTIGGNLLEFTSQKEANELLSYIQSVFESFGVNCEVKFDPELDARVSKFQDKAAKSDIEFVPYKTIHVGTDELPKIISQFKYHLIEKGVSFRTDTQVKDIILESGKKYVVAREMTEAGTEEKMLDFDAVVLGSGRSGARWLKTQADKLGIKKVYGAVDVGVRVEVPAKVLEPIIALSYDAKLRIKKTPTYGDFVRTFCTCPNG